MELTTGKMPFVFPDYYTGYYAHGNDLYHLNSVLQPATATNVPVVGGYYDGDRCTGLRNRSDTWRRYRYDGQIYPGDSEELWQRSV